MCDRKERKLPGQAFQTKRAALRNDQSIANGLRIPGKNLRHHARCLEVIFGVRPQQRILARLRERRFMFHAKHHVGQTCMFFARVHHAVGCDIGQFQFAGKVDELSAGTRVVSVQVMLKFQVETLLESLPQ